MANIGKSISIKGDVTGNEDTVVEGRVEGRIELSTEPVRAVITPEVVVHQLGFEAPGQPGRDVYVAVV